MATATFVKTSFVDATDQTHSVAVVNVDGIEVEVRFWISLVNVWGKEETKVYLCAEALWQTGNFQDAHDLIIGSATGEVVKGKAGNYIDERNWQKRWIDDHPIAPAIVPTDVDPLV